MTEIETGFKWWMRYVVVPIIGGAGVLGIIIAYIGRAPAPTEKPPTPEKQINAVVTPPVMQEPVQSNKTETPKTTEKTTPATVTVKPTPAVRMATQPEVAQPVAPPDPRDMVKFFILDAHGVKLQGQRATIPHGQNFTIVWDGTSVEDQGPIVMKMQDPKKSYVHYIPQNKPSGQYPYGCNGYGASEFKFYLVQTLPDTFRVLGQLYVICQSE